MSLQSLLEMDDLSKPISDKTQALGPRPKPRRRLSNFSTNSPARKERDADDVVSFSSGESNASNNGKRDLRYSPAISRHGKNVGMAAFENAAFLADSEVPDAENNSVFSMHSKPPKPSQRWSTRHSSNDNPSVPTNITSRREDVSPDRTYSISSQDEETDTHIPTTSEYTRGQVKSIVSAYDKSATSGEEGDSKSSNATYTLENEKYKETTRLTKKPPRSPRSKATISKIPKPQQRKSVRLEESKLGPGEMNESESSAVKSEKTEQRQEHLAIDMEPDGSKNSENTRNLPDDSETGSISSSATITKDSVKSRFGKLFNSSSTLVKDKKSTESTDRGAGARGAKSLVSRWKHTAHTFLKTSSKPFGTGETIEELKDHESDKGEGDVRHSPQEDKGQLKETRILVPESGSEPEDEVSHRSSEGESLTRPRKNINDPPDTKPDEREHEDETQVEEVKNKRSAFKPLSNLLKAKQKAILEQSRQTKQSKDEINMNLEKARENRSDTTLIKSTKNESELASQSRSHEFQDNSSAESSSEEDDNMAADTLKEKPKPDRGRTAKKPSFRKLTQKLLDRIEVTDLTSGKELLFGVTLHSSDTLPLDPNVIHPVVKVTVMYQNGMYMKRTATTGQVAQDPTGKSDGKKSKRSSRRAKDKDQEEFTENVGEATLPIMSQPCRSQHSIPTFAPAWNELLVFEEPLRRFSTESSDSDPILFFEIMDFLPMKNNGTNIPVTGFHGSEPGWYKVAWAFLKPIGANGVMNLNKKLRLQLFKPMKLRSKNKLPGPEVYSWWKYGRRDKFSCTLYVTPKGIIPPEEKSNNLHQLLSMRKEQLTQAILDSQLETRKNKQRSRRKSLYELREEVNWSRLEGQSCRPPSKLIASLPSSQIESLNIVISGSVHCTKFSPCGTKLAAGLDSDDLHVILLFDVPSWTLIKCLKGHHGIIYEISWKLFELDGEKCYHYVSSASADSTVRIWRMQNNNEKTFSLVKVLHHPSFVYCVKFHPTHPCLMATGCFDRGVRIWDIKPDHADVSPVEKRKKWSSKGSEKESSNLVSPNILLDQHNGFINCLAFDFTGQHLFVGDGAACLFKWSCRTPSLKKSWKLENNAKLYQGDAPVNCIDLHPSGNRLLVQLRDSLIKILDVATFIPLQSFPGIKNERFQIRSCFSPCGNLVLSGSEDNTICVWDADTGKILKLLSPEGHQNSIVSCVDYHPFDHYVAVGLSSVENEPSPVLIYFHQQPSRMNYPLLKKTAMKMRESLERSRSQSTEFDNAEPPPPSRNRDGALPPKRADSTEKFISIIHKLDTALYFAQQRNKMRQSEAASSACASTKQTVGGHPSLETLPGSASTSSDMGNRVSQVVAKGADNYEVQPPTSGPIAFVRNVVERPTSARTGRNENSKRFLLKSQQRSTLSDSEPSRRPAQIGSGVNHNSDNESDEEMQVSRKKPWLPRKATLSQDIPREEMVISDSSDCVEVVQRPKPRRSIMAQSQRTFLASPQR